MPTDWTRAFARIEELLQQVEDPILRATVLSFARSASFLQAPDDVGLGYWRNSVRLIWPNCETEVFRGSIEIYRFGAAETEIITIPFRSGDALPAEISELMGTEQTTGDVR